MDRLQGTAGEVETKAFDQARIIVGQAREGLERGREALVTFERVVAENVRSNSSLYAAAGAALIGLLLAKLLLDRREARERLSSER
jgi:hypothetical protein